MPNLPARHSEPGISALPPLAPEFVEALLDHATATLLDWLCLNAPPALFILADRIAWLHFHQLQQAKREGQAGEDLDGELPGMAWETINAIAEAGGSFSCPSGRTRRQVAPPSVESEETT
jgi:hypothetical protein